MAYKRNQKLHKRQRQARKTRNVFLVVLFIVFVGVAVVAFDWVLSSIRDDRTVVTTEQTRSVQSSNIAIYRTKYYQFQAVDDWVEVEDDNFNEGERYVYVKNDGQLISQRLIVYVNRTATQKEQDLKLSYVLPLAQGPLGRFINVGTVSAHCDESWPDGLKRNPSRIVHDDVSFVCAPSSKQYNIVLGERGGSENISVELDDGTEAELTIVYSDLTAYPSSGDLYNIVDSFTIL